MNVSGALQPALDPEGLSQRVEAAPLAAPGRGGPSTLVSFKDC